MNTYVYSNMILHLLGTDHDVCPYCDIPMDSRNDANIMLLRTKAAIRGATPAEIQHNVEALQQTQMVKNEYE